MTVFQKTETAEKITYASPQLPGYSIVLYKEDQFHLEMIAPWPIGGGTSSWEQYRELTENGMTLT